MKKNHSIIKNKVKVIIRKMTKKERDNMHIGFGCFSALAKKGCV
jgi:hypothetical protein